MTVLTLILVSVAVLLGSVAVILLGFNASDSEQIANSIVGVYNPEGSDVVAPEASAV